MSECTVERLEIAPEFDMLAFMELSQETRLEGSAMAALGELWEEWSGLLSARRLTCGKISYLLVWLPEEVEARIDEIWNGRPSEGYLANVLAQHLVMQAVNEVLPKVATVGCAPAPRPTESLRSALSGLGLAYREDLDVLSRRFAVVTFHPFRGGCEICHLQRNCPRGNGETGTSVLLPGFEPEDGRR